MTVVDPTLASALPDGRVPHQLTPDDVAKAMSVELSTGLPADEAARRLETHGHNRLAEAKRRPGWQRFVDQFRDFLIIILLIAAVIDLVINRELKTPIVIVLVVLLNATIGFVQGNRAEASLDALKKMLVTNAKVRRGGDLASVDSSELVPGDVVLVEAGDRIPADGRITFASSLEIEEAALTGESQPSPKDPAAIEDPGASLGDRSNMAYMNTTVTRGRGELIVTGTGMGTEIGKIAGLLRETADDETPLQKQLHRLAITLAKLAGVVVALVFVVGLIRGESFGVLFQTAVALAVASIPEGLPAVVAVTLAIGVYKMASENAIVKQLASVETLGCTSVICSDKTGTLTLNQMTARELIFRGERFTVSGQGYGFDGEVRAADGDRAVGIDDVLVPMALCNDASVRDGELVGDPTEGALLVLAAKGGVDPGSIRTRLPRVGEVPFDSATKFMATFHRINHGDRDVVRCYVKGAPDVLLNRSDTVVGSGGRSVSMADARDDLLAANDALAEQGLRVLAVAQRDLDPDVFERVTDLSAEVRDLTLLGLAGIVDPPRPEARLAIAEANAAGIAVKMITGDHATTAAAIGQELGLTGRAVSGADLDRMSDADLERDIDDISVFARVSPEHKLKLVRMLKRKGHVAAMTGDGVNDAPALKTADIGVAMGITGTEVTKEAAKMVLTDDNFATIVKAVRQGRAIYDNIVKFVRFQLSTTIGFAITFLGATAFNLAGGKPFTAIQILWVNIVMDGPPAMALGVDKPAPDVMDRSPRPPSERILFPSRIAKIVYASVIMAAGTFAVLFLAPGDVPDDAAGTVAGTMAFATFVLFQFFNILNVRSETRSVFSRETFSNKFLWASLIGVVVLQFVATQLEFLHGIFDTTELTVGQWLTCIGIASIVLWAEEIRKIAARAVVARQDRR
jgi:P-type Ca2+ transporter type 2C